MAQELQSRGFTVLAPPNLLYGVVSDAAYIASFLSQRTSGPVVLIGHSYGGFVITNAGASGGDVRALVYVAGASISEVSASHVAMASHPSAIIAVILAAVAAVGE